MTEEDPTVWMPGWQRVLIALVFLLLMNPAGAIGGPVGTVAAGRLIAPTGSSDATVETRRSLLAGESVAHYPHPPNRRSRGPTHHRRRPTSQDPGQPRTRR